MLRVDVKNHNKIPKNYGETYKEMTPVLPVFFRRSNFSYIVALSLH